jgi:putative transposase
MKTSRFRDSQILAILKQAESRVPVPELGREHGMSSASFYKWRAKYGGMDASLMARMKELEVENRRLKKMYAEERLKKCNGESAFLLVTKSGGPYTTAGIQSLWRREKIRLKDEQGIVINWQLRDLKSKGISDFKGDKQAFSGHKKRIMMEHYNRTPDETNVIDF